MMKTTVQIEKPLALIVDDDMTMRILMRESLEQNGFDVEEAESGQQALTCFDHRKPDIILLDVMMPGMDGFTTCSELFQKPDGHRTPVLMVTGLDDVESIQRSYEVGATDFITKPINWLIFSHRVRYMLRASRAMSELSKSEARLSHAQRIAGLGHWEWDMAKDVLLWSEEMYHLFGVQADTSRPTFEALLEAVHPDERTFVQKSIDDALAYNKPYRIEHRLQSLHGEERFVHHQAEAQYNEHGKPVRMIGTVQDITDRKIAEEQIRYLAYYDSLTSLPNRAFFHENISQALKVSQRSNQLTGVLFLDLDHFKRINDTLGHNVGDLLLREVADRLVQSVRKSDMVARQNEPVLTPIVSRLGGDEFTILLTDIKRAEDAAKAAQRIIEALSHPFQLENHEIFISSSIGIAVSPHDGEDVDTLLKNADIAMYYAKNRGRNNYQYYTKFMNVSATSQLTFESSLRKALSRDEFLIYYQPLLDIHTLKTVGMEALIRWQHPEKGMVLPDEFISVAEETGLIVPIGEWVLKTACLKCKAWQKAGFSPLYISVNLSIRQFTQHDLAETVSEALHASGLDPKNLQLEITESTTMENVETIIETLNKLKQMGVRLSMDDFGTGYSSLSCLNRFPLDALKVDGSFVQDISTNPHHAAITKAIIAMAHSLELNVTAERVETEEELSLLRDMGCDQVQGYLFSRPLSSEAFEHFLKQEAGVRQG